MPVEIKQISEPLLLGEGPHWDDRTGALYFVDIYGKALHKYTLATGLHTKTSVAGRPSFILPVEGAADQYLVGLDRKFVVIQWDGKEGSPATIVREIAETDTCSDRINDAKADPKGRVFGGTMGKEVSPAVCDPGVGSLYRLDGNRPVKVEGNITIANGLAWDLDQKAFYYVDSVDKKVRRYDYDVTTGNISNMKFIFDLEKNGIKGFPDGMTIDTNGNLWLAVFLASCVLNINPKTGQLLGKVDLPAVRTTSATFGGPNKDILFVTSASEDQENRKAPQGCTFMVTGLGVKGHPNVNAKV